MPDDVQFQTKPQIGLALIDRALANGVTVKAWTFDEAYGRNAEFLDGMEARGQEFVGEVPTDFRAWMSKPKVLRHKPKAKRKGKTKGKTKGKRKSRPGRPKKTPRTASRPRACKVQNLLTYSPAFRSQSWQRYRIKDSQRGPEVWEVKWSVIWRKTADGLPSRRHCLIVARNVLTGEIKYFVSNRVPGEPGISLRWLLRVAFGRWSVESCFREAKEELGLDHYEARGWRCVHRHFHLTQLSHLFCGRMRQKFAPRETADDSVDPLTTEQVRRAMNTWLETIAPTARLAQELAKQQYYQRRNRQARLSHTKTRTAKLKDLGIDVDHIKSCVPKMSL